MKNKETRSTVKEETPETGQKENAQEEKLTPEQAARLKKIIKRLCGC